MYVWGGSTMTVNGLVTEYRLDEDGRRQRFRWDETAGDFLTGFLLGTRRALVESGTPPSALYSTLIESGIREVEPKPTPEPAIPSPAPSPVYDIPLPTKPRSKGPWSTGTGIIDCR